MTQNSPQITIADLNAQEKVGLNQDGRPFILEFESADDILKPDQFDHAYQSVKESFNDSRFRHMSFIKSIKKEQVEFEESMPIWQNDYEYFDSIYFSDP